ncbi:MAG: hypothetical protein LBL72_05490 [Candidatus Accumulibacter sp.]|jgi:hypothetical protein|nr:hypothetical protein [Accumulibacter sp.]
MILLKDRKAESDQAEFLIAPTTNGFCIEHPASGKSFEFDKTKLEFFPDIAYLAFDLKGEFTLFWHYELWHSRDGVSSIGVRKLIAPSAIKSPLAILPIDAEGEVHLYSERACFAASDVESIAVPPGTASFDAIKACVPGILSYLAYCRAKGNALARFNPVDAAAALEYQLDFITAAVKHLMGASATKPDFWEGFENAVDPLLSFDLVGEEKALSDLVIEKAKTRQNQIAYFEELNRG